MRRTLPRRFIDMLESRVLLSTTITDVEWTGGHNDTIATAQGPSLIAPATTDTYRIEGTVGMIYDQNDFYELTPTVTGTLAISQSTWLTTATPNWNITDSSGNILASKVSGGTTTLNVFANTPIYLDVIGGPNNQYYSWEASLTAQTTSLGGVPTQRLTRLGEGITIGRWFWTPNDEAPFANTGTANFLADSEIRALYRMGIRNIRLLIGADNWMSYVGSSQGDYDYSFRIDRPDYVEQWYTDAIPTDPTARAALYAKWDTIKAAVNRITSVADSAKTSPTDTDMIVTLVPYDVASTLEFGPWGGDTREPYRSNRFNNFAAFWQTFSADLITGPTALSPDQVAFDLMNEPGFYGEDTYFQLQQRKLIQAIRANDPAENYTIIAPAPGGTPGAVGDVRGLIGYSPAAADKGNIVYTTNFYEPGDMASEGADNLNSTDLSPVGWMHDLPWPSSTALTTIIPGYQYGQPYNSSVPGYSTFLNFYNKYPFFYNNNPATPQQVANEVFAYAYGIDASESIPGYTPGSGYNAAYLNGRAQQIANWSAQQQVPVLISEVGADGSYAQYANPADYGDGVNDDPRTQYMIDVNNALTSHGIGWILFGYDDTNAFGLAKAASVTSTLEADHEVPLGTLATSGLLLTTSTGALDLTRLDLDTVLAFGLNPNVTGAASTTSSTGIAASTFVNSPAAAVYSTTQLTSTATVNDPNNGNLSSSLESLLI